MDHCKRVALVQKALATVQLAGENIGSTIENLAIWQKHPTTVYSGSFPSMPTSLDVQRQHFHAGQLKRLQTLRTSVPSILQAVYANSARSK